MNEKLDIENWQFRGRSELETAINEHNLTKDDLCLVGSMSLSVRGLREHNDIAFCTSNCNISNEELPSGISHSEGKYDAIGISDSELLAESEYHDVIDGFKVVRPEVSLAYKQYRNRPKDADDVELLKQYSKDSSDWDWQRYPNDSSGSPQSLFSRGISSLRNDGVAITTIKGAGYVERKYPILSKFRHTLPIDELKAIIKLSGTSPAYYSTSNIIQNQYRNLTYSGMETVFWYDILKNTDKTSQISDRFEGDIKKDYHDSVKKVFNQVIDLNSNELEQITVEINPQFRILNPAKTAALLLSDVEETQVDLYIRSKLPRDLQWLQSKGFSDNDIQLIEQSRTDLFRQHGLFFYAVLWPPSIEYHDEIIRSLESNVNIRVRDDYHIEVDEMSEFVYDIYESQHDKTSQWAIDYKIEQMKPFSNTFRMLEIELPNPRIRDNISLEMEMIKNDVRQEFQCHFPNEFYYCILHVTDNYMDNKKTKKVIDKFY